MSPDNQSQSPEDEIVDSLLESLLILCRMNGVGISRDALVAGLPLRNGRLTPALFKRAAARANLTSSTLKKPLNAIRSEFVPAVLLLEEESACILIGLDTSKKFARVILPELGDAEILMPVEELTARYSGYAIVAKLKFMFDERAPVVGKVRLRHWFWGTLAENSRIYRDIMVAAFLINIFALAMRIRDRGDLRIRKLPRQPQRQRTPAAAKFKDRLAIGQIGVLNGLTQRFFLGFLQRRIRGIVETGRVFSVWPKRKRKEFRRHFVMLRVGLIRIFGNRPRRHLARKCRISFRIAGRELVGGA